MADDEAAPLPPDPTAVPAGYLVEASPGLRLHFLDWGSPSGGAAGILLIHGLAQTSWSWAPVARRLCSSRHVVAMDLRGHGLSDSPQHGYDDANLVDDALAILDGAGLLDVDARPLVIAGHGFGASVAAWTAERLGEACGGLVLVDGGLEDLGRDSDLDVDALERGLAEPPEVLRSMDAFLADRRSFDPATWDADQEVAARSTVVEVPAGHLVRAIRLHALRACLGAMLAYDPLETLPRVRAPIEALVADEPAVPPPIAGLIAIRHLATTGHNLMRYRPDDVAAAIAGVARA